MVNALIQVGVEPSLPRIARRQQHSSSTPVPECDCSERCICAVKGYHIRNTVIPLLDHIIVELDTRFSGDDSKVKYYCVELSDLNKTLKSL